MIVGYGFRLIHIAKSTHVLTSHNKCFKKDTVFFFTHKNWHNFFFFHPPILLKHFLPIDYSCI